MPDAPPNPDLLNMAAMGRHHAIEKNTVNAFYTAYSSLELEYKKTYRALRAEEAPIRWVMPITYRGHTVHCGYIPIMGRNVFAVHKIDADKVYNLRAEIAKRPEDIKPDADHGVPDLRHVPLIPAPEERVVKPEEAPKSVVLEPAPKTIAAAETLPKPAEARAPLLLAGAMAQRLGGKETAASLRSVYGALEQVYRSSVSRTGDLVDPFSEILPITLSGITVQCGYITIGRRQCFGVDADGAEALRDMKQLRAADPVAQRRSRMEVPLHPHTGSHADTIVRQRDASKARREGRD